MGKFGGNRNLRNVLRIFFVIGPESPIFVGPEDKELIGRGSNRKRDGQLGKHLLISIYVH